MAREAEDVGGSPPRVPRPVPGLVAASLLVLLGSILLASGVLASSSEDLSFETPANGSLVSGQVDLVVEAGANVTNVTFLCRSSGDYVLIGQGNFTAPSYFGLIWDTRSVPDGVYEVLANGTLDGEGHVTTSITGVRVDNTKPGIVFLNPTFESRVNSIVMIKVFGDDEVVSLDLYIDEGLAGYTFLGSAARVPATRNWTYPWDTSKYQEKAGIGFLAAAKDAAGNEGRTTLFGIEVDNVPPSVTLVSPRGNQTLDGFVRLLGNTSEPHMMSATFEWRVGSTSWSRIGKASWNQSLGAYTYLWNTYEVGTYDEVEVRFAVLDDLSQLGTAVARHISIRDLPPEPVFLCPSDGDHLTGTVELEASSNNDTRKVWFEYRLDVDSWVKVGDATEVADCVWHLDWSTGSMSLYDTDIRVVAIDASPVRGEAYITDIEVDNTPPEPRILEPRESDYHLRDRVNMTAISDRDTVSLGFYYKNGSSWIQIGNAAYNPNKDRWNLAWTIPKGLYIEDSAIYATATDEVNLTGASPPLANREIGIKKEDVAPRFLPSMPEVIYFNEDSDYTLSLADHVTDDMPSKLKVYVNGEPPDLFGVYGENTVGNLDLQFIPVPNRNGEADVTVFVVDPAGQWDRSDLKVFIRSVPDPPYFTSVPPNLFLHPGVAYKFNYRPYIGDVDTPVSSLSILQPDDKRVSKDAADHLTLVFLSNDKVGTIIWVDITVMDTSQLTTNRSIMITVTEDWVPELRRPLPDIYLEEDESKEPAFNLDEYFHDPDHDALYYSYGNKYVRVVIGKGYPHPVSIYPPQDWHGVDTVTFRANDPTGALLEDTIIIQCNSTNDPPFVRVSPALPRLVIHENESYDFNLAPYIGDVDHELADLSLETYDVFAVRSEKYALGLQLTYPYKKNPLDITILITDPEGGSCEAIITVVVGNNHPPFMDQPPDIIMDEAEVKRGVFNVTGAFDPDWYETLGTWKDLTFQFICSDAIFAVDPITGAVDVRLPDPDFNTFNGTDNSPLLVILRVMDAGGAMTEYTFRLTVRAVNDPPVVGKIQDLVITDGITHIDLRNYIRDVDTPFSSFSFKIEDALNPEGTISQINVYGTLLVMDYRGSPARKYTINLWVLDGENRVMTSINVDVRNPADDPTGVPFWMIVLVAIATGGVAIYASKFVWGRFEPPSVQDVFLVYGDGVIIRHLSKRGAIGMDEDLAIAMLTAIQEFVQQSMRSAQLKSMQAGDNNILIERDPDRLFYIAVIHTGTVSEELRKAINSATRGIKDSYGKILKKWDGNIAKFDGVERYLQEILVITHARIPEGVRFEMEGITSIAPGKTFLFQGKDVTRTHNILRGLVEEQGSGLLISRVHPQRLHPSIPESGADCVWLSKTPTKRGVSPSNTTMILHEITTYVRAHPHTVVCLDGLEYLLVQNPLDEVVGFVEELQDMVQVDDFIMMVHVDPYALDDATLSRLTRNMVPVSDRPASPANR